MHHANRIRTCRSAGSREALLHELPHRAQARELVILGLGDFEVRGLRSHRACVESKSNPSRRSRPGSTLWGSMSGAAVAKTSSLASAGGYVPRTFTNSRQHQAGHACSITDGGQVAAKSHPNRPAPTAARVAPPCCAAGSGYRYGLIGHAPPCAPEGHCLAPATPPVGTGAGRELSLRQNACSGAARQSGCAH
jgi:hypothetical protein